MSFVRISNVLIRYIAVLIFLFACKAKNPATDEGTISANDSLNQGIALQGPVCEGNYGGEVWKEFSGQILVSDKYRPEEKKQLELYVARALSAIPDDIQRVFFRSQSTIVVDRNVNQSCESFFSLDQDRESDQVCIVPNQEAAPSLQIGLKQLSSNSNLYINEQITRWIPYAVSFALSDNNEFLSFLDILALTYTGESGKILSNNPQELHSIFSLVMQSRFCGDETKSQFASEYPKTTEIFKDFESFYREEEQGLRVWAKAFGTVKASSEITKSLLSVRTIGRTGTSSRHFRSLSAPQPTADFDLLWAPNNRGGVLTSRYFSSKTGNELTKRPLDIPGNSQISTLPSKTPETLVKSSSKVADNPVLLFRELEAAYARINGGTLSVTRMMEASKGAEADTPLFVFEGSSWFGGQLPNLVVLKGEADELVSNGVSIRKSVELEETVKINKESPDISPEDLTKELNRRVGEIEIEVVNRLKAQTRKIFKNWDYAGLDGATKTARAEGRILKFGDFRAKKYGDCRQHTITMAFMLHGAGLRSSRIVSTQSTVFPKGTRSLGDDEFQLPDGSIVKGSEVQAFAKADKESGISTEAHHMATFQGANGNFYAADAYHAHFDGLEWIGGTRSGTAVGGVPSNKSIEEADGRTVVNDDFSDGIANVSPLPYPVAYAIEGYDSRSVELQPNTNTLTAKWVHSESPQVK